LSLVHNERVKLTATYLNGLAIAIFAVGGLAPLVAVLSGTANPTALTSIAALTTICVVLSGVLHLVAKRHLGQLTP
jgi:hypothetical protein